MTSSSTYTLVAETDHGRRRFAYTLRAQCYADAAAKVRSRCALLTGCAPASVKVRPR
jgi:hypothetical protein